MPSTTSDPDYPPTSRTVRSTRWVPVAAAMGMAVCLMNPGTVLTAQRRDIRGAIIVVTSLADNTIADGQITLREAIQAANTDTSVDGSAAGSGADDIVFAVSGTIRLGGTQLPPITGDLTIDGPGVGQLTIDGDDRSRLFEIAAGATVQIADLTMSDGNSGDEDGGGILNHGTLAIVDSVLSSSASRNNGGGIYNFGSLTITRSTLSDNSALNGGGINNPGTLNHCRECAVRELHGRHRTLRGRRRCHRGRPHSGEHH